MGGGGGLANADVIRGSLNADRGRGGGVKFAKIVLTSYVNASLYIIIQSWQKYLKNEIRIEKIKKPLNNFWGP